MVLLLFLVIFVSLCFFICFLGTGAETDKRRYRRWFMYDSGKTENGGSIKKTNAPPENIGLDLVIKAFSGGFLRVNQGLRSSRT